MSKPCPSCNQVNPADAAFCLNCSAALAPRVGAPQQQRWPQQPVGRPMQMANSVGSGQKATWALVLAIAAFICCGPFTGIPAAIVGWMELSAISEGRSPVSGKTMATIGLWGGLVATVLHAIGYVFVALFGALGASDPYYGY